MSLPRFAAAAALFLAGTATGYAATKKPEIQVPVPPLAPAPYRLAAAVALASGPEYRAMASDGKIITPHDAGAAAIDEHIAAVREAGYVMTDTKHRVRVSRAGSSIVAEFKATTDGSKEEADVTYIVTTDYVGQLGRGVRFMARFTFDMTGIGLKVDPMVAFALRDIYGVIASQPIAA